MPRSIHIPNMWVRTDDAERYDGNGIDFGELLS